MNIKTGRIYKSIRIQKIIYGIMILVMLLANPMTASAASSGALSFNGSSNYVKMADSSSLDLSTFTLELWFKRTGSGATTSTGNGGFTSIVPLLTKGRDESGEPSNKDVNYFLGISGSNLAADFEEYKYSGSAPNHPITGSTTIVNNTWYHAAVTYDGADLRLYLNGVQDGAVTGINKTPRYDSSQVVGVGTAFNSSGTANGYFAGIIDEVRIWNRALSQTEIQSAMYQEVTSGTGLVSRWGMNEAAGSSVANSISGGPAGTITGATWSTDTPIILPPTAPSGLTATPSGNQINLSWKDNSSNETGFEIQRKITSGGTFSTLTTVGQNVTTYNNTGLAAATEYCYQVRATNLGGNSAYTSTVCAYTNRAPVASNGTLAVTEDITAAGTLVATDVDGNTLTYSQVAAPTKGTITIGTNGSYTYTPASNANGVDSFTFKANDGLADSNIATITVNITAVNDAPVASNGTLAVSEDTAATGTFSASDVDNDSLTYSVVTNPGKGTVVIGTNGSYTYTPNTGELGSDSFTFTASDGTLTSNTATISITISHVNHAPVASNGTLAVTEDIAATGTLPATDIDGDVLTYSQVTAPTKGTITIGTNGSYTYTPTSNANGLDTFTFKANDGLADSNTATITVTIASVNDAPVASNGTLAVTEDITATGTLHATDVDEDSLTYSVVTAPTKGIVTIGTNGSYTYTPNLNDNGADSFTFKANDGKVDSNTATIIVAIASVNDAPVASNGTLAVTENVAATGTLVAADVDSASLTYSIATQPTKGSVVLGANGSYTYTPNTGTTGADSFTFTANDGFVESNTATIAITITHVNRAPVAQSGVLDVTEDVSAAGTFIATDDDGDPLTYSVVSQPTKGVVTVGTNGSYTYAPNLNANGADTFTFKANDGTLDSNTATITVTITPVNDAPVAQAGTLTTYENQTASGQLTATDAEGNTLTYSVVTPPTRGGLVLQTNGSFVYRPNPYLYGTDSFTFRVYDGSVYSNIATFTITVISVNYAPVAQNTSFTTNENQAYTGQLTVTDVDSDPLTYQVVTAPTKGTVIIASNGSFTFTPTPYANGADSFTYKANDGSADSNIATVSLSITSINYAPVAQNGTLTLNENETKDGKVVVDDPDGDTLTYTVLTNPTKGSLDFRADGSFTYTPNAYVNGTDSFTFKANDGAVDSNTATISITITLINYTPVAQSGSFTTPENQAYSGQLVASDEDSDPLTYIVVTNPTRGSLVVNAAGGYTYTPTPYAYGADSFTYKVNDGTVDSNTATISITITPINYVPVANDGTLTTDENQDKNGQLVATDADGDPLTYTIVASPVKGKVEIHSDASFTYTPDPYKNGADSFTFKANDGVADSNVATISITINSINYPPVAQDGVLVTSENRPRDSVFIVADPDNDLLTYTILTPPVHGTVEIKAGGNFTYTPNSYTHGTDSFTFKANDGFVDSNTATVRITINDANFAPVARDGEMTTSENQAKDGLLDVTDADTDPLTYTLVASPVKGKVVFHNDGTYTFTPTPYANGADSFTFKANDGIVDSNVATIAITILPVNFSPIANDESIYQADEDSLLTVPAPGVLANDIDLDGDPITAVKVTDPAHGKLTLNADGSFTYLPGADFNGTDSFTYKANDGELDSNIATVTITTSPVNDVPVAENDAYDVNEDEPLTVTSLTGVLANDADPEGDLLTSTIVASPLHGTVALNVDGSFTYTPSKDWNGDDTFTYQASDGSSVSNVATVTITVNPVNDSPSAANDSYSVKMNVQLSVSAAAGVLANDTDAEHDKLTAVLDSGPAHGTLMLNADGSFTYIPEKNYSGADSFTYMAWDGKEYSEAGRVNITVLPGIPVTGERALFIPLIVK